MIFLLSIQPMKSQSDVWGSGLAMLSHCTGRYHAFAMLLVVILAFLVALVSLTTVRNVYE